MQQTVKPNRRKPSSHGLEYSACERGCGGAQRESVTFGGDVLLESSHFVVDTTELVEVKIGTGHNVRTDVLENALGRRIEVGVKVNHKHFVVRRLVPWERLVEPSLEELYPRVIDGGSMAVGRKVTPLLRKANLMPILRKPSKLSKPWSFASGCLSPRAQ